MKISILLETTANELYRKIDALDAMIKDPSTTQGEKDNAATLKQKLLARLQKEFPNSARNDDIHTALGMSKSEFDWYKGMAAAAKKEKDLNDLKQNDPEAYKRRMEEKLKTMQDTLVRMRRNHLPGNVDTAYEIRNYAYSVESFMRREFPEKYAELQKQRDEKNRKAYDRAAQKKAEKDKLEKEKLKKSGKSTWKEVGKEYEEDLKKLHELLVGTPVNRSQYVKVGENYWKWGNGHGKKFLAYISQLPIGKIREAWNKLDSATQQNLRDAISKVNTMGYKHDGFTTAQQAALLAAMSPYKAK